MTPWFTWRGNCFSSCEDHLYVYVYITYRIYVKVWCLKFVVTPWFIWRAHCLTTWCAHLAQKGVLNCSISDHEDCSRLYPHTTCVYTIACLCGFVCVSVVVGWCAFLCAADACASVCMCLSIHASSGLCVCVLSYEGAFMIYA